MEKIKKKIWEFFNNKRYKESQKINARAAQGSRIGILPYGPPNFFVMKDYNPLHMWFITYWYDYDCATITI